MIKSDDTQTFTQFKDIQRNVGRKCVGNYKNWALKDITRIMNSFMLYVFGTLGTLSLSKVLSCLLLDLIVSQKKVHEIPMPLLLSFSNFHQEFSAH